MKTINNINFESLCLESWSKCPKLTICEWPQRLHNSLSFSVEEAKKYYRNFCRDKYIACQYNDVPIGEMIK